MRKMSDSGMVYGDVKGGGNPVCLQRTVKATQIIHLAIADTCNLYAAGICHGGHSNGRA